MITSPWSCPVIDIVASRVAAAGGARPAAANAARNRRRLFRPVPRRLVRLGFCGFTAPSPRMSCRVRAFPPSLLDGSSRQATPAPRYVARVTDHGLRILTSWRISGHRLLSSFPLRHLDSWPMRTPIGDGVTHQVHEDVPLAPSILSGSSAQFRLLDLARVA